MVIYELLGQKTAPEHKAVVSLSQANPVSGTKYTVLDTVENARLINCATKIVWANQMYDICQNNGADYETIRRTLHRHPWGSKHHLRAVHKGGRGAGGKCIPKDLAAFTKYSTSELLKTVEKLNKKYLIKSKKE